MTVLSAAPCALPYVEFQPALSLDDILERADEVLLRLGAPPTHSVTRREQRRIEATGARLLDMAGPRATYVSLRARFYNDDPHRGRGRRVHLSPEIVLQSAKLARSLNSCHTLHVFVASLGPRVDALLDRTMRSSLSDSVVLDAVASVAADLLADRVEEHLSVVLQPEEALSVRFSPGYCDWPVHDQAKLFSVLPQRPAGVELSPEFLMRPRKSISGILGVGMSRDMERHRFPCTSCGRTGCEHRRAPWEPPPPLRIPTASPARRAASNG